MTLVVEEKKIKDLIIHCDGSGNGKWSCIDLNNITIKTEIKKDKNMTNNETEYLAVLLALNYISTYNLYNYNKIIIYSDSQLVVRQIRGEYSVKAPNLIPFWLKCKKKINEIEEKGIQLKIRYIERKKNLADPYTR